VNVAVFVLVNEMGIRFVRVLRRCVCVSVTSGTNLFKLRPVIDHENRSSYVRYFFLDFHLNVRERNRNRPNASRNVT
jgi:hypothetical protein